MHLPHRGRCVTMQMERGVANSKKFIYTNVKIDKFDGKNQLHFQPCKTGEIFMQFMKLQTKILEELAKCNQEEFIKSGNGWKVY